MQHQTAPPSSEIDEAHLYKNRAVISGTRELSRPDEPARVTDLDMKLRHLRDTREPGRPLVAFATGTPIPNSVREMWVMQAFLRPDLLADAGLDTFDAWAAQHLRPETRLEMKPTGSGFAPRTRVSRFVNVPEITRLWSQIADQVTRDDLPVQLPVLAGGTRRINTMPRSAEQIDFAADLERRMAALKGGAVDPAVDNMLAITGDGRRAALDQRLVDLPTPDGPARPDTVAARMMQIWQTSKYRVYRDDNGNEHPRPGSLQIGFCDQSTPKPNQWNIYAAIRDELIQRGMPPERIAFVHTARSDAERAELFAAARDGRVSVLLGSTHKLGTGANIQTRLLGLHHIDVPWRPADLEQREGREIRQGNQNPEAFIDTYVTEASFDAFSWQLVATKQRFIAQVKTGGNGERHIDHDDSDTVSFEEVAAASSGDPRILRRHQLTVDVGRLSRLEAGHRAQAHDTQWQARRLSLERPNERVRISSPEDIVVLISSEMAALDQEELRVVLLNTKNEVLRVVTVYRGSVNAAQIRVAEVFKEAVRHNAPSLVIAHNHPSGDPTPSSDDVAVTRELVQAGRLLDIEVLDHLVIGDGRHVSLRRKGLGFS